ncbi:ankyrin repeat protein, putative [Trichomonas vaginalis G3]|uniref:Ankyrin repeat protein, putative n=1 Tax=Trichomonas vaginalis (strain ATCC PRA-98 / G3) TaxID=412133 RepID=A2EDZ1_TRIV3|nr:protein ubiquitination [Trichomonas vaginalis G3]EAY09103.1 ankyrin repeat protein, putative [Trichomonas vaginalis G3]KAI5502665.1 protein ubiquitination [Trichomonas vaginalis G3]|eukprot:XP_001321326.1 ankyrin repeat protein [Trichomonas vaginalis G3]
MNAFSDIISSINALYKLNTADEEVLEKIYQDLKFKVIETKQLPPDTVLEMIGRVAKFRNRYIKSYWYIFQKLDLEYLINTGKNTTEPIKLFLYNDSTIDELDFHEENTIYKAIMDNNVKSFARFIEEDGFDKDKKLIHDLYPYADTGYTILELCCHHGALDCFRCFRSKFDVEITKECVELAFFSDNPEILNECFKYIKPDEDTMKYAILSHNLDFVIYLMNNFNLEIDLDTCTATINYEAFFVYLDQTKEINKCLFYSPGFHNPSLCEYLLNHGADINAQVEFEATALNRATQIDSTIILEYLFSKGADLTHKDYAKKSLIHYAAYFDSPNVAEILISKGADLTEKDDHGNTPLHYAVLNSCVNVMKIILSHEIDVNAKNNEGKTPVHYESYWSRMEILDLLLAHGADINAKDNEGRTALHVAAIKNNSKVAEYLITHGADINILDNENKTARVVKNIKN